MHSINFHIKVNKYVTQSEGGDNTQLSSLFINHLYKWSNNKTNNQTTTLAFPLALLPDRTGLPFIMALSKRRLSVHFI